MTNVAINGLGRIGRATLKTLLDGNDLELVAANDLVPIDNLAYLLRYDTVYGRWDRTVEVGDGALDIDGRTVRVLNEKDPARLPWRELGVDIVFECTGAFTSRAGLEKHLEAGAERAILSAPAKGDGVEWVTYGVNQPSEDAKLITCASCTTNCIAPIVEIVDRRLGVEASTMTTVHAYTSSQGIVDGPNKSIRRGRAAAANLVPTSTGAARATTQVLTHLEGRFDGSAVRAPVPVGSISDVVLLTRRETSVEEVNAIFEEEAASERYDGIVGATHDPLVSSDVIGDSRVSIVDLEMTRVVAGKLVKVMSWYDNEWGYSAQMVRTARHLARRAATVG